MQESRERYQAELPDPKKSWCLRFRLSCGCVQRRGESWHLASSRYSHRAGRPSWCGQNRITLISKYSKTDKAAVRILTHWKSWIIVFSSQFLLPVFAALTLLTPLVSLCQSIHKSVHFTIVHCQLSVSTSSQKKAPVPHWYWCLCPYWLCCLSPCRGRTR